MFVLFVTPSEQEGQNLERIIHNIDSEMRVKSIFLSDVTDSVQIENVDVLSITGLSSSNEMHEFIKEILADSPEIHIVYVLDKNETDFDKYRFGKYTFFIKAPLDEFAIRAQLASVAAHRKSINDTLTVQIRKSVYTIPVCDILYLESKRNDIYIVTKYTTFKVPGKITDFCDKNENLERCHQSFIVNIKNVTARYGTELFLSEFLRVPISRRYLNKIKEKMD